MKRVLCLLFILVAVYATGAEFKEVVHKSEVLQTEKSFLIHVPEGAGPENRLPVLYILHGAYSNPKDWVTSTTVTSLVENYRMIVVLPDGSELGWYVDSPIVKNSRYETYVSKDLVDYVDAHYPTVKDRTGRGIMG
ncbi:MAG TPA: alpha/beta hydrolase-fold protein, partial [Candidatus Sumerlaeota bacterium]|nr:alpha/beta hydrolase-fold protein [Candidatus Sumerlaeota bacterium]